MKIKILKERIGYYILLNSLIAIIIGIYLLIRVLLGYNKIIEFDSFICGIFIGITFSIMLLVGLLPNDKEIDKND